MPTNVNNKNGSLNGHYSMKKNRMFFDLENWLWMTTNSFPSLSSEKLKKKINALLSNSVDPVKIVLILQAGHFYTETLPVLQKNNCTSNIPFDEKTEFHVLLMNLVKWWQE